MASTNTFMLLIFHHCEFQTVWIERDLSYEFLRLQSLPLLLAGPANSGDCGRVALAFYCCWDCLCVLGCNDLFQDLKMFEWLISGLIGISYIQLRGQKEKKKQRKNKNLQMCLDS